MKSKKHQRHFIGGNIQNNHGFIATAILYSLVLLIIVILFSMTYNLSTIRKIELESADHIKEQLSGNRVIYNYSYNGGDSIEDGKTVLRVKKGFDVDLSKIAKKDGYEFVGWNTEPNAIKEVTSLKMGEEDITLYAIYRKNITVTLLDYKGKQKNTRYIYPAIYNNDFLSLPIKLPGLQTAINGCGKYVSGGWTLSPSASPSTLKNFEYKQNSEYTFSEDVTLYGIYSQESIFYLDKSGGYSSQSGSTTKERLLNGSGSVYNNGPYKYTFTDNARYPSLKFLGWYCSGDGRDCQSGIYWSGDTVTYNCSPMYSAHYGY